MGDAHANLEALGAVLADVRARGITEVLFLGDAVGYGPDPDRVTLVLAENCAVMVMGNHDRAVLNKTSPPGAFNPAARAAMEWTVRTITDQARGVLASLELTHSLAAPDVLLVHSSPDEPGQWRYLCHASETARSFRHFTEHLCLVGHSHKPFIAELTGSGRTREHLGQAALRAGHRYIVNAGSVGQPRDGDPRSAYAVIEPGRRVRIVRVAYDIAATQKKMQEADLPQSLVQRLKRGA